MAADVAESFRPPIPMDVIRQTSGMPAVPLFEHDRRSSVGRDRHSEKQAKTTACHRTELDKLEVKLRSRYRRWKKHSESHGLSNSKLKCARCAEQWAEIRMLETQVREHRKIQKKGSQP